ncbi:unnamed protein product [Larinioides sclopetarius]|uniref:Uncharacterized protein n=1 Tax=Larinioides sclopetarius TaxID=280406 RepID=A0AAV2B250_9ARAC
MLIPYIEMCKKSKPITCGCSIILIGLAIFCFFATNYMINYPVTEARKIAFVFAGIFSLVAAASCLNLRFRISPCTDDPDNNVLFEIARRDTDFSDSFSGRLTTDETSFYYGSSEGQSKSETPEESISRAYTIDDPSFADVSRFQYTGHVILPRHSISDNITPDTPLLPERKPLGLSGPFLVKNGIDSKRLQNSGTILDNNKYPPNYSTFENGCEASTTEPLLAESTFQNGHDTPKTEPLLAESTFQNGHDTPETEPQLSKAMFQNDSETLDTEPLLPK